MKVLYPVLYPVLYLVSYPDEATVLQVITYSHKPFLICSSGTGTLTGQLADRLFPKIRSEKWELKNEFKHNTIWNLKYQSQKGNLNTKKNILLTVKVIRMPKKNIEMTVKVI